jgi:2-hydroxy-3-oxopropionate reductase
LLPAPLGDGQKVKLVNNALFAAHIGLLSSAVALGARLGVPESTLLTVLPFVEFASEFVAKDVAVARRIAAELGSSLGVLDDVIDAAAQWCDGVFSTGDERATVSVTVTHSIVSGQLPARR